MDRQAGRRHPATGGHGHRWQRRAGLARLVRLLAWATPIAASSLTVMVASRLVRRPPGPVPTALYWIVLLALGTFALWLTERLARRLLPLAAMLHLSLAFPDRAPSRFAVALRAGNLGRVEDAGVGLGAGAEALRASSTPAEITADLVDLVGRLHAHDRRTRGHSDRVRAYAVMLGHELKLEQHDIDRLQWAALLHDIGKLNVPAELLNLDRELTEDEFDVMRRHPADGARMVEPLRWWLGEWTDAVGQHHERFDGSGYPLRLAGTDISWAGRIVAVADAYDVMTVARAYKAAFDPEYAKRELTRCAGTHFDPVVVRAFLSISIGRLEKATGPLAWLANIPIIGSAPLANAAAAVAVSTALLATGTTVGPPVHHDDVALPTTVAAPTTGPPTGDPAATSVPPDAGDGDQGPTDIPEDAGPGTVGGTVDPTGRDGATPDPTTPAGSTPTTTARPGPPVVDTPTPTPTSRPLPVNPPTSVPATTTTTPGYRPSGDVVTPEPVSVADVAAPAEGSADTALLAQSGAAALIYVSCEAGEATFDGTTDPVTIWPQGAAQAYACEFMADRGDGTIVQGTFTVVPA